MKYFLLPYNKFSQTAKALADNIGARLIKLEGSKWTPGKNKCIFNWGQTQPNVAFGDSTVINAPDKVAVAVNKLQAFEVLHRADVAVPDYTSSVHTARAWFLDQPKTVVFCRTLLRSHSGKGIVVATTQEELVNAPLFTKRVKKHREFRIHVFRDTIVDVVQKRLRNRAVNDAERNAYVRNLANGWIFAHENVECPDEAKALAIKAVKGVGS